MPIPSNTSSLPEWQHQAAENRFSAVVKAAASGTAQMVTMHGIPAAVVLSPLAYERLLALSLAGQNQSPTPVTAQSLSQALCCPELDDAESLLFSRRNQVANSGREIGL